MFHKKEYPLLEETLYSATLPNGLTVHLLPKTGFHKTYGIMTTEYGSIDNEFIPLGETEFRHVPDGIAHFLEHKLFEKEDGDVFQTFGKQGASANAFTSFTRTSYLFSTTSRAIENVETLLDFVQEPYFTEQSVNKEKGIIAQEIQMYEDDPNWRLFFGALNNMYPKHPLHIDIAGTVESIQDITAEDLYQCHETFYHPSNMNLFVVGNFDLEQMQEVIISNQSSKSFAPPTVIERRFPSETLADIVRESAIELDVQRPKVALGIKGIEDLPETGYEKVRYRTAASLLLQLLFGSTSQNYADLYDEGLLDDTFSYEFEMNRGFYFALLSGEAEQPEELAERLTDILLTAEVSTEITAENLELLKKRMMGKYLQSLNSLEYIANQFGQNHFGDVSLFDMIHVIESIQLEDIHTVRKQLLHPQAMTRFYIYPKGAM
ncbi:EF-P 5-aminopentanol modification-associated protein YfmH [Vagococcus lutrae]|uniref:EF-P 5-aminopentanol modification-associated protein YfmH n=1 Tax=Vagococcus lutrae TaxID=81947 RepID=UPI0028912472|nr:pitrilysin family protein [Vagococcus lutrae]MDT2842749.1 pitrilysin family protein [Vagococcus lutrae]